MYSTRACISFLPTLRNKITHWNDFDSHDLKLCVERFALVSHKSKQQNSSPFFAGWKVCFARDKQKKHHKISELLNFPFVCTTKKSNEISQQTTTAHLMYNIIFRFLRLLLPDIIISRKTPTTSTRTRSTQQSRKCLLCLVKWNLFNILGPLRRKSESEKSFIFSCIRYVNYYISTLSPIFSLLLWRRDDA